MLKPFFPERFTPFHSIQAPDDQLPTPPVQMLRPLEWLLHCQELRVVEPLLPEEELLEEELEEELDEELDEELEELPLAPKLIVQLPLALFQASAATMA